MLMEKNRASLKVLNNMNKTAVYYASKPRTKVFGWQHNVVNMVDYQQITQGDMNSKGDKRMEALKRKVKREEEMHAA